MQVIFLNTYYEWSKSNDVKKVVNKVADLYKSQDYDDNLDLLSYQKDVCIEIISDNNIVYSSGNVSSGCMLNNHNKDDKVYKIDFMESSNQTVEYQIKNPFYDNKVLVYGIKISNGTYAFVSTSLDPINSTISVLVKQYKYVTFGVLILSFIIAYFVSKRISKPILKISEKSNLMSKGNYKVKFEESDIYELNELASILNKTSIELEHTEELRREFLANVSHDLKTPLTIIKANAEMVKDITYNNKDKRNMNLDSIIKEVDRLNLLVEDILDVSKVQSSTMELKIETFNLNELIMNVLSRYTVLMQRDGYSLVLNADKDYMVKADIKRIEQVIYNLINNAINYTGEDKKVIINLNDHGDTVLLEVVDTGKGIDDADIDHIWDKYYKVDKSYKRVTHGTGLGLSIVKNFLQLHKFEYGVESKKDIGTKFYFYITKSK